MVCVQRGISGLRIGGRTSGWFGMKGQPDGYSVRNIFEVLFTEYLMGSGKAIFEGGFKFEASEASKSCDIIA